MSETMNVVEWFRAQGVKITDTGAVHVVGPTGVIKTLFVRERANGIVVVSESVHNNTYRSTYKTRERALKNMSARNLEKTS